MISFVHLQINLRILEEFLKVDFLNLNIYVFVFRVSRDRRLASVLTYIEVINNSYPQGLFLLNE